MNIDLIIENATKLEEENATKEKTVNFPRLEKLLGDGEVTIRTITPDELFAMQRKIKTTNQIDYGIELSKLIIVKAVTNIDFNNKELLNLFGVHKGTDVVLKLFNMQEVGALADNIMTFSKLNNADVEVLEEAKVKKAKN